MPSKLYESIIEKERQRSSIENYKLKAAAKSINLTYSKTSLERGSTYLNYNFPEIPLIAGGSGTDIVGIFKALAMMPYFYSRIRKVSVLDNCSRWQNCFEDVMLDLSQDNVGKVISNADIICMVKFISKILTKKECKNTLQVLGKLLKPGAVMLFIDNFEGNVSLYVEDILKETGLKPILGPLHETYGTHTNADLETYGCPPEISTKISVIGWMKTNVSNEHDFASKSYSSLCVQSENELVNNISDRSDIDDCNNHINKISNTNCDKYTQTDLNDVNGLFKDKLNQTLASNEIRSF
ncbi:uncharacterized protein CEXT_539791 [Caerostris extrusa]|uniref:Methyltransferase type 11 domain-containing protein n=1 Tax=Caerostris extrusa TaxID=172846 RepID=A0AAV4QE20_CAEEX|nr:uncharacterized protein CEXT_539791 [Caerostris extrusa]